MNLHFIQTNTEIKPTCMCQIRATFNDYHFIYLLFYFLYKFIFISVTMADKKIYNLKNPLDVEAVLKAVMCDTDDEGDKDKCFSEESDTDQEEHISERDENSDTELSAQSSSEDDESETDQSTFQAVQNKNKKIINVWTWQKQPRNRQRRSKQNILLHLPGVIGPAKNVTNILDSWKCLITDAMIQCIVDNTNKFIITIQDNYSRSRDARQTDNVEIKALFGLLYLAGVYHANRLNLEELWRMDDFLTVMSIKRFQFLMRAIRFDDLETREERRKADRLAPIRSIFEEFVGNCQKCYSLGDNVTIDEKLEAFRGRCGFIQYIPKKPSKYGIKIYALVDARLCYAYNMEIYAGTQPDGPFSISNKPSDVVRRLAEPIYHSGRNITADNWFTDYDLVKELASKKLSYVGTIRKNKPQIPPEFTATRQRAPQTSLFGFQKDATLVSYVPKKYKNVLLISSLHNDGNIDEETGDLKKPEIISFYNMTKGGVDTLDKLCGSFNVARNTKRWPLVVFFSLMNVAAINSFILYKGNNNDNMKRRRYLRKLYEELVQEHIQKRSAKVTGELRNKVLKKVRLAEEHHEEQEEGEDQFQEPPKKRCRPCLQNKKTRITRFKCEICNQFICLQHSKNVCNDCILSK